MVGSGGSILGGVGFLWVVVGSGRSILGGGWWWSILCMVVGLVGGDGRGRSILGASRWWWVVVDGGG